MKKTLLLLALAFYCTTVVAQPYFKNLYRRQVGYTYGFVGMCHVDSTIYLNGSTIVTDSVTNNNHVASILTGINMRTGDTLFCTLQASEDSTMYNGDNSLIHLSDSVLVSGYIYVNRFLQITGSGGIQFYNIHNHTHHNQTYPPLDTTCIYNASYLCYNPISNHIGLVFHQIKKTGYLPDSTILYVLDQNGNVLHRTGSTIQNWGSATVHYGHIPGLVHSAADGGFYIVSNGYPSEIMKTNSMGDSTWTVWPNYNPAPALYDMVETPDGGILLCGRIDTTYHEITSPYTPYPGNKCALTKFNVNHHPEKTTRFGRWTVGAPSQGAFNMLSLPNHDVVIIGANDTTTFYSTNNAFLSRRRQDGSAVWERYYDLWQGAPIEVWAMSLDTVPQLYGGGYLLSGNLDLSENLTTRGGEWGWLIRTDSFGCLVPGCQLYDAVDIVHLPAAPEIRLWPNPATEYTAVQIIPSPGLTEGVLTLSNINGEVLRSQRISLSSQTQYIMPLEGLSAGAYFVSVQGEGATIVSTKLIKN